MEIFCDYVGKEFFLFRLNSVESTMLIRCIGDLFRRSKTEGKSSERLLSSE